MLGKLRQNILSTQETTGRRKMNFRFYGLSLRVSICSRRRIRIPLALTVNSKSGLERFTKLDPQKRKQFLAAHENPNFIKHRSFRCLVGQK